MAEDKDEIKEYHFHTYFMQHVETSKQEAINLHKRIQGLMESGYFPPKGLGDIYDHPIGPHPVGMFQLWVPKEYFASIYSWFVLNRGTLTVLIHPLSKEEMMDHTSRGGWIGQPYPLDLTVHVREKLDKIPLQFPELGLGYSAIKK